MTKIKLTAALNIMHRVGTKPILVMANCHVDKLKTDELTKQMPATPTVLIMRAIIQKEENLFLLAPAKKQTKLSGKYGRSNANPMMVGDPVTFTAFS